MRRILALIAVIICFCGCIKEGNQVKELKIGDRIPDFEVTLSDGTKIKSKDLIGSPSCIMFFHTSCPDCRQTLPVMQEIYDLYNGRGIKFVLISREQSQEDIDAYWTEHNLTMPFSPQTTRKVYNLFAQTRIPRVYISDKDGIIRSIYTDDPIPVFTEIDNSIQAVL